MNNEFEIIIPDQPYTKSITLNKSITVEYTGDRFIMIGIERESNKILRPILGFNPDETGKNVFPFNKKDYETEYELVEVIDAEIYLLEASKITGRYKFKNSEIYKETLVDNSVYEHEYESINQIFDVTDFKYFPDQKTFSKLEYLDPYLTKESFWESWEQNLQSLNEVLVELENQKIDTSQHKKYLEDLINASELFKNTDHWKIPINFGIKNPFESNQDSLPD